MGERGTDPRRSPARRSTPLLVALACLLAVLGIAACGGDEEAQDANEPEGEFPVEVAMAKFPARQRLAETHDLLLEIENAGSETIPDLAITIFTGDEQSDEPFNVRTDQEGLADPNRPVWILEEDFPKVLEPGIEISDLGDVAPSGRPEVASAGAETAATNTFAFGALPAGESVTAVWRVTPVMAGTFTVNYQVAGGIDGNARAVTPDGSPVEGEFVATVSRRAPDTRVTDSGEVVPAD